MLSRDFDPMAAVQKAHQETAQSEIRRQHLARTYRNTLHKASAASRGTRRQGFLQLLTHQVSCTLSLASC